MTGHPRVCGENGGLDPGHGELRRAIPECAGRTITDLEKAMWIYGPSPRVRGERQKTGKSIFTPRAIPACAGRTSAKGLLRGAGSGPSPRVRGELKQERDCSQSLRAIPACAGRTRSYAVRYWPARGPSPRVRGEHAIRHDRPLMGAGHPRVCGENGETAACPRGFVRAIPACAGRT